MITKPLLLWMLDSVDAIWLPTSTGCFPKAISYFLPNQNLFHTIADGILRMCVTLFGFACWMM
jgi:hypothetical protein